MALATEITAAIQTCPVDSNTEIEVSRHKEKTCCDIVVHIKDSKPAKSFPWSDEDTFYTRLFRAWDTLPLQDPATETQLLAELDAIIPFFDEYIGHNDLAFRSWIKRHQRAMELGLVDTPTWPKLYRTDGMGKKKWLDDVWINRYSFLVHQRDIIAKSRLQRMACCTFEDKKCFFGTSWAYPRQTLRTMKTKQPARLRNCWHEPMDYCLARMSYESLRSVDFHVLRAEFWGYPATLGCAAACQPIVKVEEKELSLRDIEQRSDEKIKVSGTTTLPT